MRFGIHCSIRNGYVSSLKEAKMANCDALQMFTHSPRVWKFKLPEEKVVNEFILLREQFHLFPLVIHTAYLPNPASSDTKIYNYTRQLLVQEFELATMFRADYIVMHPGSYSEEKSFNVGVTNLVQTIDLCFDKITKFVKNEKLVPMLLLENVCGKGRKIGKNFEELKIIIDKSKYSDYIGICIDTAHLHSSGYELDKESGFKKMVEDVKNSVGIEKLKMFHLNDSKVSSGTHIDRHEHIGQGTIGVEGFKRIVNYYKFKDLTGIIETPKEVKFGEYSVKDKENILLLKKLLKN